MKEEVKKLHVKFEQIKSDLLHGGYSGTFKEEHALDVLTDEIVSETLEEVNPEKLKAVLKQMFMLGVINHFSD